MGTNLIEARRASLKTNPTGKATNRVAALAEVGVAKGEVHRCSSWAARPRRDMRCTVIVLQQHLKMGFGGVLSLPAGKHLP